MTISLIVLSILSVVFLFLSIIIAAYILISRIRIYVYITTIDNDMGKVIKGKREILRTLIYNLAPAFFTWLSWTSILGVTKFFSQKSQSVAFYAIYEVGFILIVVHFVVQFSRFQIDAPDTNVPHRLVQALHGLLIGIMSSGTQVFTTFLADEISRLQ